MTAKLGVHSILTAVLLLPGIRGWAQQRKSAPARTPSASSVSAEALETGNGMAATVRKLWPSDAAVDSVNARAWNYESGTLLDGMAAQWEATAKHEDFAYIQATVDRWVDQDGNIHLAKGRRFNPDAHVLDDLEPGRAVLLCYRVTGQERYAKAAAFLFAQFANQPRTPEGGFWHKEIYPQQMWLDGAYMAEPFRAAYAHTFQRPAEFDDIAAQLLLMDKHMRDPKTGLLLHGWDAKHQQPWADKQTGLSQEAWARAMGWYAMALVDTLPWFPEQHPARAQLIAALDHVAVSVAAYQDKTTGVWWDVLDKGGQPGNFREASASAMFVYALAKGVRLGYLPAQFDTIALAGWSGLQHEFVTRSADGNTTLHGTVKVSGLGGTPYRAGDYAYYTHEAVVDNDAKGIGAILLAASEIARGSTNRHKTDEGR